MILKIVKVGDYTPSQYDGPGAPLSVPFYCVDDSRGHITLNVLGTRPRFWAEADPRDLDLKARETMVVSEASVRSMEYTGWMLDAMLDGGKARMSRGGLETSALIESVLDEGFATFGTGVKCWTVYVRYPFHVVPLRDALHVLGVRTNASDVVYKSAVRIFYGLRSPFIEIPDGKLIVDVSEIRSVPMEE